MTRLLIALTCIVAGLGAGAFLSRGTTPPDPTARTVVRLKPDTGMERLYRRTTWERSVAAIQKLESAFPGLTARSILHLATTDGKRMPAFEFRVRHRDAATALLQARQATEQFLHNTGLQVQQEDLEALRQERPRCEAIARDVQRNSKRLPPVPKDYIKELTDDHQRCVDRVHSKEISLAARRPQDPEHWEVLLPAALEATPPTSPRALLSGAAGGLLAALLFLALTPRMRSVLVPPA